MSTKQGRPILIAVVGVLLIGGALTARSVKLTQAARTPTRHGLAASAGGEATQSMADLTDHVNAVADGSAAPDGDTPLSLIPVSKAPLAPDFALTTLDGKSVKLSDAVKKGPVLLDFWAIWCGPCRMEMPELGDVYAKYKQRGFQVYGINSDATASQMKRFFVGGNPGYPMLADTGAAVAVSYNIGSIPALYLVDGQRRVRAASIGFDPDTSSDLPASLNQLYAEKPQVTSS